MTNLIPLLKEIIAINPTIKIMGSPWSPPVWMKDNNSTIGGSLQPKYYNVYAQYLVKYIQQMKAQGIVIDAITSQNETFSTVKIETFKEWNLDDNSWLMMNEPGVWKSQELGEFDGVVWLRKHITLTKQDLNNNTILNIPAVPFRTDDWKTITKFVKYKF